MWTTCGQPTVKILQVCQIKINCILLKINSDNTMVKAGVKRVGRNILNKLNLINQIIKSARNSRNH